MNVVCHWNASCSDSYTAAHEWVKVEDGIATIGITDYAQDALGEIVFCELPEEGDEFELGGGSCTVYLVL